jgi:hypothetical protein
VPEAVEQRRADPRSAVGEAGSEPPLGRRVEHRSDALGAHRGGALTPAVRCADDRAGAQEGCGSHPVRGVERQLQTDASADGIACIVEGLSAKRVGERQHTGGEILDGESFGGLTSPMPRQIPSDDPDVRGQQVRDPTPEGGRRCSERRSDHQ